MQEYFVTVIYSLSVIYSLYNFLIYAQKRILKISILKFFNSQNSRDYNNFQDTLRNYRTRDNKVLKIFLVLEKISKKYLSCTLVLLSNIKDIQLH